MEVHLCLERQKYHELNEDRQCLGRYLNRVPLEYKSRLLPLEQPVLSVT
jgi:hypothetical protein